MSTALPGIDRIPHTVILPYFLLLPGYAFSLVLRQADGVVQTIFYSLVWSVAILGSIYSLTTFAPNLGSVTFSGVVPIITIILTVYAYYHRR